MTTNLNYKNIHHWKRVLSMIFLLLFSIYSFSFAQTEKFTASASSSSVENGEQFQVTFSVNASAKSFRAPTFSDFTVIMGPSQSNQMQIINGSVSQTLSFTYVLQAVKEGSFKIGPAEIIVGSNKLLSNPLSIIVSKGSPPSQSQSQNNQKQSGTQDNVMHGAGKNVFIKASLDKSTPYQGEGISVIYKIYSKVTLLNFGVSKLPSFAGFWSQDIDKQPQLDFHNETVDGVAYKVADIKRIVLFPQRSGQLEIDPMECEVIARVPVKRQQQQQNSNDPFSQFFNDPFFNNPFFNNNAQDVKIELKSDPIKISVKDLPNGAPSAFKGAVGKLNCEINLDRKEAKANEAVNIKVKISGRGNIKLLESPQLTFPPDFETYDPKENVNMSSTLSGVSGTKTFEYLVIPRNAGEFKIQISPFVFFDLEKKQYSTINFPDINLKVNRGNGNSTVVNNDIQRSDVQQLGKDIHYIKTEDAEFKRGHETLFGSVYFYTLSILPALAFLLLVFVKKKKEKEAGNFGQIKSQRANKEAMKRLSLAKKYLNTNENDKFLDEMFRALWGFISDKLRMEVSELSKEKVMYQLKLKNVPDEIVAEFGDTVESCEFARFAGGSSNANETLYLKGINVITKLDSSIK